MDAPRRTLGTLDAVKVCRQNVWKAIPAVPGRLLLLLLLPLGPGPGQWRVREMGEAVGLGSVSAPTMDPQAGDASSPAVAVMWLVLLGRWVLSGYKHN